MSLSSSWIILDPKFEFSASVASFIPRMTVLRHTVLSTTLLAREPHGTRPLAEGAIGQVLKLSLGHVWLIYTCSRYIQSYRSTNLDLAWFFVLQTDWTEFFVLASGVMQLCPELCNRNLMKFHGRYFRGRPSMWRCLRETLYIFVCIIWLHMKENNTIQYHIFETSN